MTISRGEFLQAFGGAVLSAALSLGAPAPAAAQEESAKAVADIQAVKKRAAAAAGDYERARWDPIHFKPAIDVARDEACLVCHGEITRAKPRAASPAGVKADQTEAWYQTLDTYAGKQEDFHWRHTQSPFARQAMNLSCNFCHQGNDVREEAPNNSHASLNTKTDWPNRAPAFTLRKMVNPTETCLRCHGNFPAENMGLAGTWPENREGLENAETPNGCLTCHAEQFRTNRHQVSYLHAGAIEDLAKKGSDVCYGCHGGRQWYRTTYPYPRHDWPDMPADVPDWAKDRPKQSDARFALPSK